MFASQCTKSEWLDAYCLAMHRMSNATGCALVLATGVGAYAAESLVLAFFIPLVAIVVADAREFLRGQLLCRDVSPDDDLAMFPVAFATAFMSLASLSFAAGALICLALPTGIPWSVFSLALTILLFGALVVSVVQCLFFIEFKAQAQKEVRDG